MASMSIADMKALAVLGALNGTANIAASTSRMIHAAASAACRDGHISDGKTAKEFGLTKCDGEKLHDHLLRELRPRSSRKSEAGSLAMAVRQVSSVGRPRFHRAESMG